MIRLLFLLLALVVGITSSHAKERSASDPELVQAFGELQRLDHRMNAIGYRLVTANSAYCDIKVSRAGLLLHSINQYADQETARAIFGFSGSIAINAVAPDSPAAAAGLTVGDSIIAINDMAISEISDSDPTLDREKPEYRQIAAVNQALEATLTKGKTQLTVERNGDRRVVSLDPVKTCTSRFQIRVKAGRNASATGKMVSVTSGLAEYFKSDDEFAAVVAHELSHNLLNHRERLNAQKVNRSFFGQFGKSARRIKATEIEADRLSVWLMANAGYDPEAAIRFWTRYGKRHGKGIFSASTHYRWKKRVKLFKEEIAKMANIDPVDSRRAPPLLTAP